MGGAASWSGCLLRVVNDVLDAENKAESILDLLGRIRIQCILLSLLSVVCAVVNALTLSVYSIGRGRRRRHRGDRADRYLLSLSLVTRGHSTSTYQL